MMLLCACGLVVSLSPRQTFNYLELVLQWPPTSCKTTSCNSTDAYFTLHGTVPLPTTLVMLCPLCPLVDAVPERRCVAGLWPTDNNANYPCTCNSDTFDPSKVCSSVCIAARGTSPA